VSYAIQVWTVEEPALAAVLPDTLRWTRSKTVWSYGQGTWQVTVARPRRVAAEMLPAAVAGALPGIGYLTELQLCAVVMPNVARRFVLRAATAVAKRARGVIVDLQADTATVPAGVQRFIRRRVDGEYASLLALSWWFNELLDGSGYRQLLQVFAHDLPEALPRRYGSHVPPEHVYAEEGPGHFLEFLSRHARGHGTVWYPNDPVADVLLGIPESLGPSRKGFRCAYLTVTVDADALQQPGWQTALQRFWQHVSETVRPFYGDVRTLHGYRRSRGRYLVTRLTAQHPVRAWWWGGLPLGPAHAVVLGEPYRELWPEFTRAGDRIAGLSLLSTADWRAAEDVFDNVGPAPVSLRMNSSDTIPRDYPSQWPFAAPRTP
jgi:hypothetical protein